jgi:calcineurin-like phosphoesterase family protein
MNQGLNGAVIAYHVIPTHMLVSLTEAIATSVGNLADTFNTWDKNPDQKWFHVTIANRLDRTRAAEIYGHLKNQLPPISRALEKKDGFFDNLHPLPDAARQGVHDVPLRPPLYDEEGLRITVVRGGNILAEYDLEEHCWLYPDSKTTAPDWQHTLEQYRKKSGIQLMNPRHGNGPDIFVIGDLHLGHANIIRYCSRPFPHDAVTEMDQMLINNWNLTVQPSDTIYHIGDLCYGPDAKSPYEYLRHLNGAVSLVRGNHDAGTNNASQKKILVHKGILFILAHNPDEVPKTFSGWVIHGHHHNNNLEDYPFINFEKRRINVSAEVVRYQPVSLSDLGTIIKSHSLKLDMENILLREV